MRILPFVVLVSVLSSHAQAQERRSGPANEILPAPRAQDLPPPRSVPVPQVQERMFFRYEGPQVGRRNVWELVIPDSRGVFVDRVIAAPPVPYYLRNGRPYPWTTTSSLPYMSYVTD